MFLFAFKTGRFEIGDKVLNYICRNDNIKTKSSTCPVCGQRTELTKSNIYWCETCKVPLYQKECQCCGSSGRRLTTDIRPVFPEERLLLEIMTDKTPGYYEKMSVWNCSGNRYIADGQRVDFAVKDLKNKNPNDIRIRYENEVSNIDYRYFNEFKDRFIKANRSRYEFIVKEAVDYIKNSTKDYTAKDMFVSFSGGKDSTVTSDLVMRALSEPKILHIFGDTTLEFPETMKYIERFKKEHPQTPVVSSRNKDKDFEELCALVGPPSRVMRWCCTIFKTGAIQRKITSIFKGKKKVLMFNGLRRNESKARSKYERDTGETKIAIQKGASPIIDWMNFDVWLYILTTGVDINNAYFFGYERVGCWCCPNNGNWSEVLSSIYMPEQYNRFHNMLVEFAKKIGKPDPEVYVAEGGWKARQGGNGLEYAKTSVLTFEPCALQENTINFELQKPIDEGLYELFKPFGYLNRELGNKRLGEIYVTDKNGKLLLKLQGHIGSRTLKVSMLDKTAGHCNSFSALDKKIKCQITKYQMCMGCLACESVCAKGAISIVIDREGMKSYKIHDSKCVRCGECIGHFDGGCYMRRVMTIKR